MEKHSPPIRTAALSGLSELSSADAQPSIISPSIRPGISQVSCPPSHSPKPFPYLPKEATPLDTSTESWAKSQRSLRKMPKSSSLSLAMRSKGGKEAITSPTSPQSPSFPRADRADADAITPTAVYHNVPESPASPKVRKNSKSIFSNFGATRSSSRIASPESSIRQIPGKGTTGDLYANSTSNGSTPELSRPVYTPSSEGNEDTIDRYHASLNEVDNRSEIAPSEVRNDIFDQNSETNTKRAPKQKKQGMLTRSKSIKIENGSGNHAKPRVHPPKLSPDPSAAWGGHGDGPALKTAPLEKGQSWRQNIFPGKLRTHSADRHDGLQHAHRDDDAASRRDRAEQASLASGSFNESRGAALMSSLGSGARKMGERMGTARKGMFGKLGRTSSNHDREIQVPKEPYQFKIIHLPLVEQTRKTRISNRLEDSKDKTEFWMPALPWRCIDYLNMRGCEEEGLYRVPGAAHTVKYYEQKFDQDHDIDLISDDNLNDPNVIGSLFKNWLRQLPDEIFPKATQARIQQECQGAKTTPQMLKDELSKLPPFNYYLLFAITCHISLLHSCSEYNKMNYNNLCICFQPAIKIDAFCFQFLILDWRNCWQGCWTEKEFLTEEVKLLEAQEAQEAQPPPTRNGPPPQMSGKTKGSQASSGYLGEKVKSSTARSISADRTKPATRGISAERSGASGRATPPNGAVYGAHPDRLISSSDSRETFNSRATTALGAGSVKTGPVGDEDDNSATPTQAQHHRGGSEQQFRLDLTNPPSSPFSLKF